MDFWFYRPVPESGFGLFGVILDVELDLTENRVYEKSAIRMDYTQFPSYFEQQFKRPSGVDLLIARPSIALDKQFMKETVVTIWKQTDQKMTQDLLKLRGEENVGRDRFLLNLSRKYEWGKRLRWYLQKKLVSKPGETEIISRNNAMAPPTAPYELLVRKSSRNILFLSLILLISWMELERLCWITLSIC